jgi:hypothetical protein
MRREYLAADISLGVSLLAAGAATLWLLLAPRGGPSKPAAISPANAVAAFR